MTLFEKIFRPRMMKFYFVVTDAWWVQFLIERHQLKSAAVFVGLAVIQTIDYVLESIEEKNG